MIANAFQCYELADRRAFLASDFNVACDRSYRRLMFPAAAVALAVYAAGVPLLLFWRLRTHRRVLRSPAAVFMLGFAYRDYKEEYCYWECGELLRKFVLCGLLKYIEPGSANQIILGLVFCVMSLSLVAYCNPYNLQGDNFLSECLSAV